MKNQCPSCNSINAKTLSVIEKMGSSSGEFSGSGVGVSLDGSIGAGVASGKKSSKTELAKEVEWKEPERGDDGCYSTVESILFLSVFAIAWVAWENMGWLAGIATFVIAFAGTAYFLSSVLEQIDTREDYGVYKKRVKESKDIWKKTWMCLDCGHKWIPKNKKVSTPTKSKNSQEETAEQEISRWEDFLKKDDLDKLFVPELKKFARYKKIKNLSSLNKANLIKAIKAAKD